MENLSIGSEAALLGEAVIVGVGMGLYFDSYQILRKCRSFGYTALIIQDILFWFTSAIGVFFATVWFCGGRVRPLFVLTAFAGWAAYSASIGAVIMLISDIVIKIVKRVCVSIKESVVRIVLCLSDRIKIEKRKCDKSLDLSLKFRKKRQNIKKKPCNPQRDIL